MASNRLTFALQMQTYTNNQHIWRVYKEICTRCQALTPYNFSVSLSFTLSIFPSLLLFFTYILFGFAFDVHANIHNWIYAVKEVMRRNVYVCLWMCVCISNLSPFFIGKQIWLFASTPIGRDHEYSRMYAFTSTVTISMFVARLFLAFWFCLRFLTHAYDDDSSAYNDISSSLSSFIVWTK